MLGSHCNTKLCLTQPHGFMMSETISCHEQNGIPQAARLAGWAAVEGGERDVELPRVQLLVRREAVLQRRLVAGRHHHAVRLRVRGTAGNE